jgi:hypothetical protein
MKLFANYLPLALATALVLTAGVGHGRWTNRWGASPELRDSKARLLEIPKAVGDWVREDPPPDEGLKKQLARADVVGSRVCQYRNRHTGDAISVLIVSGLPGPIAAHTPEICYGGRGYELVPPVGQYKIPKAGPGGREAAFFVGDFRKEQSIVPAGLRILWSWAPASGIWQTTNRPRSAFLHSRYLYKIYAVRETAGPGVDPGKVDKTDPSVRFLETFMPAIQPILFPPAEKAPSPPAR